jgi:nucleoside-diphosphate-sugar epimerase
MKQISILGCGWLGLPLAKSLLQKGFFVKGSTTSPDKIPVLESCGIHASRIEVSETGISGEMDSFLEDSEILIIDIPPKLQSGSNGSFVKKIEKLIPFIKQSAVQNVILISSTAVYNDSYPIVTETTQANPDTESGKQLLEAENLFLLTVYDFGITIVRFGGLVGEDRHPVYHLAGKQNLGNPDAPINLIHQADCIGIIGKIIELDCWNKTFNAVAPFHPTREKYYTKKAAELGLPLPEFAETGTSFGKTIHSDYLEETLQYKFKNTTL